MSGAQVSGSGPGTNTPNTVVPLVIGLVVGGLFAALLVAAFLIQRRRRRRLNDNNNVNNNVMMNYGKGEEEGGIFTPDVMHEVARDMSPTGRTIGLHSSKMHNVSMGVQDYASAPAMGLYDRRDGVTSPPPQLPPVDPQPRLTLASQSAIYATAASIAAAAGSTVSKASSSKEEKRGSWPAGGDPQRSTDVIFSSPHSPNAAEPSVAEHETTMGSYGEIDHVFGSPIYGGSSNSGASSRSNTQHAAVMTSHVSLPGTGRVRVLRTGNNSPTVAAMMDNRHSMEWPDDDDRLAFEDPLTGTSEFPPVPKLNLSDPRFC